MDFDEESASKDRIAGLGESLLQGGPEALFDEIEEMLPEQWREQVAAYPLVAITVAFGVGVFLGFKKGDEIIAAGAAMMSAAATANLNQILSGSGE